ncbi:hypothetical protein J1792_31925 [Streptomyces triculaminicus]|uniref:Uncharacterized protein n=1 Tax=Streptomyces triculaminicus TaxID=2816232 RepID=A0A939JQ85_9ACTN|nr:hypothetical protein [Streptomyces triculaminicus]MBO0657161.1 hypothetical protein [Streptomyces triculaminicus]
MRNVLGNFRILPDTPRRAVSGLQIQGVLTDLRIPVPAWAQEAAIVVTTAGLRFEGSDGFGAMQICLGTREAEDAILDDDQAPDVRRTTAVSADSMWMPPEFHGTTQPLHGNRMCSVLTQGGGGGVGQGGCGANNR